MYLSRLQLLGFKSFPEKTELKFDKGITCVVGPNGCGKTNLLDAIRWVLGETRMSVLRGSRLEEIIFAGTRDYKPLGMAEVSLSFDNHDHTVPSGYNEIDVTRRLFRSGDSEFLINRTPCRLKDITDMFLDTGLGPGAYSVIEQSMVDVLISDKTEDRRFLFEEAAGITKYKQRKRLALRKLEATESDLLRLQDVLAEVGSQVSMLKRQVSKAERYKDLKDEIKRIGMSISSAEWTRLFSREQELAGQLDSKKIEAETNRGKQSECELKREKMVLDRTERDRQARDIQTRLDEAVSACHRIESEISVLKEKLNNASKSFSQAGSDIDNLVRRHEALDTELEENLKDQREVTQNINELNGKLAVTEAELESKLLECSRLRKLVEDCQEKVDSLRNELTGRRENQLSLDLRYDTDSEKLTSIEHELRVVSSDIDRLSSERDSLASEKSGVGAEIDSKKEQISEIKSTVSVLESEIDKLETEKRTQVGELEKVVTRLEFLEKVISDYEGYGEGTAAIGRLKDGLPGLIDTVANLAGTDANRSTLIQSVLGEYAGYFVVEDDGSANAVLDRVRSEKLGRVGLIVKNRIGERVSLDADEVPDGCKPVRSLVGCEDSLCGLFDFLFDGHYLIDTDGCPPAERYPDACFWNDDGEMVASGGRIRSAGSQEVVLVGRKRELESLGSEKERLIEGIAGLNHDKVERAKKREGLLSELDSLTSEVASLEDRATELSIRNSNVEFELVSLGNQKSEKQRNRDSLTGSISSITEDRAKLTEEVEKLLRDKSDAEASLENARLELNASEEQYSATEKESSRLKMELVGMEGRLSTLRANHEKLGELKDDIDGTILTRRNQQTEYLSISTDCKRSIRENEDELKSQYAQAEERRTEVVQVNTAIAELDEKINSIDKELRELRKIENQMLEAIHEFDLEMSSVRSRKTNLLEESRKEYEFDPSASSLELKLSDDQIADMNEELDKLRKRLDGIGPVNMLALDEYDEQSKRHQFLSEQVADLTEAKEDLKSTISKINTTAKRLFVETFESVRSSFQEVFKELFEGGEADVKLEEGVDPLEANIIITARPRGKKILSIQQLSGGERALTSISLLFSLYLVKPSPFCILDEVDAPLDDANIARFLKMIRRFSESTQFVIITHNKLTMEAADVLYGVTMKQPGVSQIVSVNLNSDTEREAILGEEPDEVPEPEELVETE